MGSAAVQVRGGSGGWALEVRGEGKLGAIPRESPTQGHRLVDPGEARMRYRHVDTMRKVTTVRARHAADYDASAVFANPGRCPLRIEGRQLAHEARQTRLRKSCGHSAPNGSGGRS